MNWVIIINPQDSWPKAFRSELEATKWAIKANKKDKGHPAYLMFLLDKNELHYKGRLCREFGWDQFYWKF